ncbi:hypothetical protein [Leeuwenhoekiella parthenopeia]|uniref:Uncharacterized protein n=1 Tax=Leeuwenhoekiella parthenopeia TaxID=2890320 RepID=A0ABS8GXR2_9FLAO|nr:hypothetical protein [Leeuwenhoekiella parthenopeia]MCC4214689.1 hypothetical protein [Leeuwenhoekiella parthenopeia]
MITDYPLTFSRPEAYYPPKYTYYTSSVFRDYGVIDWVGLASVNGEGHFTFNIPNLGLETINLYIEGMTADGQLISDVKTVRLSND